MLGLVRIKFYTTKKEKDVYGNLVDSTTFTETSGICTNESAQIIDGVLFKQKKIKVATHKITARMELDGELYQVTDIDKFNAIESYIMCDTDVED